MSKYFKYYTNLIADFIKKSKKLGYSSKFKFNHQYGSWYAKLYPKKSPVCVASFSTVSYKENVIYALSPLNVFISKKELKLIKSFLHILPHIQEA